MEKTKELLKQYGVWVIATVVLVGFGWYIWQQRAEFRPETNDMTAEERALAEALGIEGGTVNIIDDTVRPTPPEIERSTKGYTLTAQDRENIVARTQELEENPYAFNSWISLGITRKQFGDYEGAEEAWVYAGVLSPENTISFSNLGKLYHFYLKDFAKAEASFKRAIANDSENPVLYKDLHDLYALSYKQETESAADILLEGIEKNSTSITLRIALADYYKDQGNTTAARNYYRSALEDAEKLGDTSLVQALEQELANL